MGKYQLNYCNKCNKRSIAKGIELRKGLCVACFNKQVEKCTICNKKSTMNLLIYSQVPLTVKEKSFEFHWVHAECVDLLKQKLSSDFLDKCLFQLEHPPIKKRKGYNSKRY